MAHNFQQSLLRESFQYEFRTGCIQFLINPLKLAANKIIPTNAEDAQSISIFGQRPIQKHRSPCNIYNR
jgi:hypothetical protein